jgi:DNA-binding MarR family transcriptional regulator
MDEQEVAAQLFGSLFVLVQRMSRVADEELAALDLTSRQWLLLAVVTKAFPDGPPTLSQAAAVYGTSRQNVKQIAVQLQRQGWLTLRSDPADARSTRLVLTDKVARFADPAVQQGQAAALDQMFAGLDRHQRRALLDLVRRCLDPPGATPASGTPRPPATPRSP